MDTVIPPASGSAASRRIGVDVDAELVGDLAEHFLCCPVDTAVQSKPGNFRSAGTTGAAMASGACEDDDVSAGSCSGVAPDATAPNSGPVVSPPPRGLPQNSLFNGGSTPQFPRLHDQRHDHRPDRLQPAGRGDGPPASKLPPTRHPGISAACVALARSLLEGTGHADEEHVRLRASRRWRHDQRRKNTVAKPATTGRECSRRSRRRLRRPLPRADYAQTVPAGRLEQTPHQIDAGDALQTGRPPLSAHDRHPSAT